MQLTVQENEEGKRRQKKKSGRVVRHWGCSACGNPVAQLLVIKKPCWHTLTLTK